MSLFGSRDASCLLILFLFWDGNVVTKWGQHHHKTTHLRCRGRSLAILHPSFIVIISCVEDRLGSIQAFDPTKTVRIMQPFANIIERMPFFSCKTYVGLMKFVIGDLGANSWDTLLATKHIKFNCILKKIAKMGIKL